MAYITEWPRSRPLVLESVHKLPKIDLAEVYIREGPFSHGASHRSRNWAWALMAMLLTTGEEAASINPATTPPSPHLLMGRSRGLKTQPRVLDSTGSQACTEARSGTWSLASTQGYTYRLSLHIPAPHTGSGPWTEPVHWIQPKLAPCHSCDPQSQKVEHQT